MVVVTSSSVYSAQAYEEIPLSPSLVYLLQVEKDDGDKMPRRRNRRERRERGAHIIDKMKRMSHIIAHVLPARLRLSL